MIRGPATDFWRVGVVRSPIRHWLEAFGMQVTREEVVWLPDPGSWRYLADPFGLRRGDATHVFVEAFDYRTKHAVIERHEFGPNLEWRCKETVLARPFHLSYPFIVEADGEVFMVPESHRAGEIALYRARKFPGDWVRETAMLAGIGGAEPSLIRHGAHWWMFFTVVGPQAQDQRELHVAYSEKLTGPWRLHPLNPVLNDRSGARPGGTPFLDSAGSVVLPVQDCSRSYGGGLGFVRFSRLQTDCIQIQTIPLLYTGDYVSTTHCDGFHTLAACGELTLIDAKTTTHPWGRVGIDWRRRLRRLWR